MRYSFPADNEIIYGQDMNFHQGVPANVVFTAHAGYQVNGWARLTAPGYGQENDYGNGPIYVSIADLPAPIEQEPGE